MANVKKGKGTKGKGNKPNGKAKRDRLRADNRAFMNRMKSKTRQFKRERIRALPGTPNGLHLKGGDCRCGSCNRGFVQVKT